MMDGLTTYVCHNPVGHSQADNCKYVCSHEQCCADRCKLIHGVVDPIIYYFLKGIQLTQGFVISAEEVSDQFTEITTKVQLRKYLSFDYTNVIEFISKLVCTMPSSKFQKGKNILNLSVRCFQIFLITLPFILYHSNAQNHSRSQTLSIIEVYKQSIESFESCTILKSRYFDANSADINFLL